MFSSFQNAVEIRFRLEPTGPLLVRSGVVTLDPAVAEMEFQRTVRNGRSTVFLAGSGLKGALRAHCERLLRSAGKFACDPGRTKDPRTHQKLESTCFNRSLDQSDLDHPFAGQCAACFTFGSVNVAGRFRADDAFPADAAWEETNRTEARTQVGLDRASQAPSQGALYNVEAVVGGGFDVRVCGENFTLWQLGLVLQAIDDLHHGLFHLGGCKSRGMGRVEVAEPKVTLHLIDGNGTLRGAQKHEGDEGDYALPAEPPLTLPAAGQEATRGLFRTTTFAGDEPVSSLRSSLVAGPLRTFLGLGG